MSSLKSDVKMVRQRILLTWTIAETWLNHVLQLSRIIIEPLFLTLKMLILTLWVLAFSISIIKLRAMMYL